MNSNENIEPTEIEESNIALMDNDFTKEEIEKFRKTQKRIIYRRRRLAAILLIGAVFFIVIGFSLVQSYANTGKLKAEKKAILVEQKETNQKLDALDNEVKLLKDDEYVQKLARYKYYYSREGETIYNIPQKTLNQTKDLKTKKQPIESSAVISSSKNQ